ncbi:hypothetical protein H2199_005640 [Coniosporium tulheliwenetii]|uniref:Uncharacterized protein n=1 Tax=Coniosporium tulheliwenetii TaxID=3383036 RepID=A0ACC2YZZ6_9PEZI|nr:hypothetical protein H2199_005640 [Cladosporium sp. JES 115]
MAPNEDIGKYPKLASDRPTVEEVIVYESGDRSAPPDLRFIHYNDVYHVDASSAEPVGGIARFQHLVNHYRNDEKYKGQTELLTFFSGDAFNPSLESSVTKGQHMVPVLNGIGTDVACVGNHDLDFGITQYRHLTSRCSFPWLLANVLDPALGDNVSLGNVQKTIILTASNGIKIGVIGLVEREWLDTINSLPPNLVYKSVSATAKELVPGLRAQGCELIVAVAHQREPNDNKLAQKTEGLIDLVLGAMIMQARRAIDPSRKGKWDFTIIRRDVVSSIPQDPPTVQLVEKLTSSLRAKLEKPVGYTAAPLDARFTTVRLKESNIGNFVADLMRFHYGGDCCIMAAGTIRGDQIYPPGVLRLKDIMNCFPFEDPVVVLRVKGAAILAALENSVSTYPALEGRFPQVSNIFFTFNPELPPDARVISVKIGQEPLDIEKEYVLVTRGYMARGKDGYDSLLIEEEGGTAVEIVSEENGVLISTILRQFFMSLKVLGKWKQWGPNMGRHWSSVQKELQQKHKIVDPQAPSSKDVEAFRKAANEAGIGKNESQDGRKTPQGETPDGTETPLNEDDEEDENTDLRPVNTALSKREHELSIMRKVMRKWWRLAGLPGHPAQCDELTESEFMVNWTKAIAPRVEGRIQETTATKA